VDDDSIDLIFQQKGGGAVVRSSRLKAQTGARSSSRLILSAINGAIRVKNSRISIGPVFTPACYSKDDVESGALSRMTRERIIVFSKIRSILSNFCAAALPLLALAGACTFESPTYEYIVLVTSLPYEILSVTQLYRDRADVENPFDELKNQWGWAGFTTHDFERCQIAARLIALIYNWWSLFVRLVDRERHREAVTSRPALLGGVARQTRHAGQNRLSVNLTHARSAEIKEKVARASLFLRGLITTAEQLSQPERWRRILQKIFERYLGGRSLTSPIPALSSG
jgi:hypothetical protein